MLLRRSKKLKADKNIFSGFMAWYGLGCKWLTCISSCHLTGQPGKETVPLYNVQRNEIVFIVVCRSLYLNEMHWMHSPGHPDLALNVSWQIYLNKTIYNFIEQNVTRICSNDLHPRELIIWVTLLYDE